MIQTYSWKPDQLFFFDKDKNKGGWQKRQKKPMDSLPITLFRETGMSVSFSVDKLQSKGKKESNLIKNRINEEGDAGQENLDEQERKPVNSKKRNEGKWSDLEYEEEEDTQRFLFEEAKFSAPSLLAQIEKFLILLLQQKTNQKEELEKLNEEIEAVYGSQWSQGFQEGNNSALEIPDDLFSKLCSDFEQFAEGTVYVVRKWQTNVYRELAALHELRSSYSIMDFQSIGSSPDLALLRSPTDKQKIPAEEREKKTESSKMLAVTDSCDGKAVDSDREATPITSIYRESKVIGSVTKPKTRLEKFKIAPEKEKSADKAQEKTTRRINVGPHDTFEEEIASVKAWESNFERALDNHSNVSKRRDFTGASNFSLKTEAGPNEPVYNQAQNFLPGSIINFSMTSKSCHDKGWILTKSSVEDLEQKSILEWVTSRLQKVLKQKKEEETKATLLNETGPVMQRFYGDSKREATIKYKQGVAWAKFLSQKKSDTPPRLFLTTLPDGSTCCYYPSGRVAVICVKWKPGKHSFYTIAYSDEPDAKMIANFTPLGEGCCNHSDKIIRFLVTRKEASFNDENGILIKRWKWAYGKMMSPEVVQLNENISIRCVSQNSIVMIVNINGEVAKFPVSPFSDALEQDLDNLGFLLTNEPFSSRTAVQMQQPRKKMTKEERRARNQKRDILKTQSNNACISDESLTERLKDLDEKFPERKDMDFDAPYLMELHRIQRKVRNIIFDWMEHYRSAIGISRPSKLSLLMKKRKQMNSANSLPGSMPSFPRRSTSPLPRAPSAPPVPKLSPNRISFNAKEVSVKSLHNERIFDNRSRIDDPINEVPEHGFGDIKIDVPQLPKTSENTRSAASASPITRKSQTSESPRQKTPRLLFLPKEGCPVALHFELIGDSQAQCRCDKRRMPYIMDLEYDAFVREHVPKTQLIVISIISTRLHKTPCDDMLDDLYYEKNKARTLLCTQARFDPYRLLRYDIATAAQNNHTPLLLRRHNVTPGMFLMYSGGKLLFADYIFNGYGNAKRDLLNQIMRTRKDSMAGTGLAQDFRFSSSAYGREPRTAWGSEMEIHLPGDNSSDASSWDGNEKDHFVGFPSLLNDKKSKFACKERERRKNQSSLVTYNRISNMQY